MDLIHHGDPGQYTNEQPTGWPAVNSPARQPGQTMASSSGGLVVFQGTHTPASPIEGLGVNIFRTPVASTVRPLQPLLPRPQSVHTPSSSLKSCVVCGRSACTLSSHRYFADQTVTKRKVKLSAASPPYHGPGVRRQSTLKAGEQVVRYPVMMDAERQQLLSLWSRDWGCVSRGPERHLFPVRWIDQVLPTATGNAALFQALLATSASRWDMARTTTTNTTAQHLQLADQILNQTCVSETVASRDECILAALLLTLVYQSYGNRRETDRRFASIVRLVVARGGPYYLGMSGVVADQLLHLDYLQAVLLGCEPVWKLPLPALQIGITPRLGVGFRDLMSSNTFNTDVLLAADSVCRTTDIFGQSPDIRTSALGAMNSFGYLSTISEYQLAHCNAVFHGSATWDECICLALLLFNHVVLRNNGAITDPVRKIEQQFWQTIERTTSRGGFREIPPCLLLWLLVTGLSSSILGECEYRSTAIRRMRAAKISAALTGWDHFRQRVLDDFVWMRAAQEETFRNVWLEAEEYNMM